MKVLESPKRKQQKEAEYQRNKRIRKIRRRRKQRAEQLAKGKIPSYADGKDDDDDDKNSFLLQNPMEFIQSFQKAPAITDPTSVVNNTPLAKAYRANIKNKRDASNAIRRSRSLEEAKQQTTTVPNDNVWVDAEGKRKNPQIKSTPSQTDDFAQEHPNLASWRDLALTTPFAVAAYPFMVGASSTAAGQTATSGLTWLSNAAKATPWIQKSWPWADAALTSIFGAHGLNEMRQGRFTPETALEVAPLIGNAIKAGKLATNSVKKVPQTTRTNVNYEDVAGSAIEENPFKYKSSILNASPKEFYYLNKISGKPAYPSDNIVDNGIEYAVDTYKGLPSEIIKEMQANTSARQVKNLIDAGVPEAVANRYYDKAAQLMKDVRVGEYTVSDYINAGKEDFDGFYNGPRNFISIKRDYSPFEERVWRHESRHLLDDKLDQNLAESLGVETKTGSDFDNDKLYASILQATDDQEKVLSAAYGDDFVNLPNTKYAGPLEGYTRMRGERVTTNRDSRDIALDRKTDWEPIYQNQAIDNVPDDEIFSAVESSNGYGRRYIEYLRDNGLLTHEKANQFREAMKKVGIAAAPFLVGGTSVRLNNKNQRRLNPRKKSNHEI